LHQALAPIAPIEDVDEADPADTIAHALPLAAPSMARYGTFVTQLGLAA
jgi:hypothetical protein